MSWLPISSHCFIGTAPFHLEKQLRDGSIPHDLGERLTAED
jgi:hypothetical protein